MFTELFDHIIAHIANKPGSINPAGRMRSNTILMNYWTQNPEVLTQIGFEAKIFKFDLWTIIACFGAEKVSSISIVALEIVLPIKMEFLRKIGRI